MELELLGRGQKSSDVGVEELEGLPQLCIYFLCLLRQLIGLPELCFSLHKTEIGGECLRPHPVLLITHLNLSAFSFPQMDSYL